MRSVAFIRIGSGCAPVDSEGGWGGLLSGAPCVCASMMLCDPALDRLFFDLPRGNGIGRIAGRGPHEVKMMSAQRQNNRDERG